MSLRDFTPEELAAMREALMRTATGVGHREFIVDFEDLDAAVRETPMCPVCADTGAFPSTSVTCEGCGAKNLAVFYTCMKDRTTLCAACHALATGGPGEPFEHTRRKKSTHPLDRWMR